MLKENRQSTRHDVVLPAQFRTLSGLRERVLIHDISAGGCRISGRGMVLRAGDRIVLRPEGLEGIPAQVRWIDHETVGLCFDRPLYEPVVEHLHRRYATFLASVSPMPAEPLRRAA